MTDQSLAPRRLYMWAGGKHKLLKHYAPLFPADTSRRPYVEPFFGGGAVFNALAGAGLGPAVLSDINAELIGLLSMVRDAPEDLIARMAALEARWMPLSSAARKALYYELRRSYWEIEDGPEATALLYFLMKTGFNGIWQTCRASRGRFATPVGLANQRHAVFCPETVRLWSRKLSGARLMACDYASVPVAAGAFVFCDPPYRGSFTSYGHVFDDDAQDALIEWCRRTARARGATVWLSNRDLGDGFWESRAPDARILRFPVTYTAGRRRRVDDGYAAVKATEVLLAWNG